MVQAFKEYVPRKGAMKTRVPAEKPDFTIGTLRKVNRGYLGLRYPSAAWGSAVNGATCPERHLLSPACGVQIQLLHFLLIAL